MAREQHPVNIPNELHTKLKFLALKMRISLSALTSGIIQKGYEEQNEVCEKDEIERLERAGKLKEADQKKKDMGLAVDIAKRYKSYRRSRIEALQFLAGWKPISEAADHQKRLMFGIPDDAPMPDVEQERRWYKERRKAGQKPELIALFDKKWEEACEEGEEEAV